MRKETANKRGAIKGILAFQRPLFLEPQGKLDLPVKRKLPISDESYELKIQLRPHGKRIRSVTRASLATQNTGRNIGNFYVRMHSALFNHEREAEYTHEEFIEVGEERIQFKPDLKIDGLRGVEYVEVKGKTLNGSQVDCGKTQIEAYSWAMLRDYYSGKSSSVDFAFFRYGYSHRNLKLHSKVSSSALEMLAGETKEALVIPLNLLLLLVSLSKKETRIRTKEKNQDYFRISGRAISLLGEMDKFNQGYFLNEFKSGFFNGDIDFYKVKETRYEDAKRFARRESLCLDEIVVKRKISDELRPMHYNGTQVNPYSVTIYALKNPDRWVESFARNHQNILKTLKLRDLYQEQRVPF